MYFAFAAPDVLISHTQYNHFALLADGWLHGRLDLPDGPPDYAQMNDFAKFKGQWYVAFPPFPAVLLLPVAAVAGEAELVRDGQFFVWLAGVGPGLLFLALERLSARGLSPRSRWQNVVLSVAFAFGSVYFFCAVQGTVWFAAHVVGVALAALYLFASIEAKNPLLAGVALGFGLMTRAPLAFAAPLFALEALRSCASPASTLGARGPGFGGWWQWFKVYVRGLDWRRLSRLYALFALPILLCLGALFWMNWERFGSGFDNGYQYLTVAWQTRIKKWGLFHYHYLSRNLGIALSMLPWLGGKHGFQINVHGLALWFTTPLYLWLLWPKTKGALHWALWASVLCIAAPTLFYQNTGWAQFGYRFSNDYAVFLIALLAIGARPLRWGFALALAWSIAVNAFGAWTFGKEEHKSYYYVDGSQTHFYQRD